MNIKKLESQGFVGIPYPPELKMFVARAAESWKEFCSLSSELKARFPYSNEGAGVGYERKGAGGPSPDPKENFDVSLSEQDWLASEARKFGDFSPIVFNFLDSALRVHGLLIPLVNEFAKAAEKEFGLVGFADEIKKSSNSYFPRFIHYFGDCTPGEETAGAHPDQSGFTLHLFESAPGLQCYNFDGKWVDMPVSDSETVIIPSMQLQYRSRGRLKALNHRVIATDETAKTGRYSAVCFVQLAKTAKYDKKTNGRLQEIVIKKGPGFNYGMSPEEFGEYFQK